MDDPAYRKKILDEAYEICKAFNEEFDDDKNDNDA